jgi:hypothetical protein
MFQLGVDCDESLDTSAQEHVAIFLNQILSVSMMGGKVKISRGYQVIANSAHYLRVIAIA